MKQLKKPFRLGELIRFVASPQDEILLVIGLEKSFDTLWVSFLAQRTGTRQCLPDYLFEPVESSDV